MGREDCLRLNVYSPVSALKADKRLPVVVYLHGGAFLYGSGNPGRLGAEYFMDTEEVVLVTVNYRLGLLGFLSTEDDVVAGNMALWDQVTEVDRST